jgi:hypothetical protein
MIRICVFKVGPLDDKMSLYVPIGERDGKPIDTDPVEASDDVSGLRKIIAQRRGDEELVCSMELAETARTLGLVVEELPDLYEGARIRIALELAAKGQLKQVTDSWSYVKLMSAVTDFIESDVIERWPLRQAFDVELRGDRSQTFSGLLSAQPTSLTLVGDSDAAKQLALLTGEERAARLASVDHLTMTLVTPPPYARTAIEGFYQIAVMPRLEKRAAGQSVLPTDEDALVVAGVLSALTVPISMKETGHSETKTPGRIVRTFVHAGSPFPFVEL